MNREGRSANLPWMQEFKKCDAGDRSWGDVLRSTPIDAKALGLKDNDLVEISSPVGTIVTEVKLWEGVGPALLQKPTDKAIGHTAKLLPRNTARHHEAAITMKFLLMTTIVYRVLPAETAGTHASASRKFLATINPGERNEIWNDH